MSVAQAIRNATQTLGKSTETPRLDAELLMAHALNVDRSTMLLRHLDQDEPAQFAALVARRMRHEPIAYILEEAEFYGRSFYVNPAVLIPRGDSEVIIDAALARAGDARRVLDMGAGSGALLITYLAEQPQAEGVGIDASLDALQIAALNARRLRLGNRARMLRRNWRDDGWQEELGRFDLVLCNPPYVEESAELAPDVRDFEPAEALFAGPEGLDDYRIIIPQLRHLLAENATAIFEIGHQQAEKTTQIAADAGFEAEIWPDLAGRARAMILTR